MLKKLWNKLFDRTVVCCCPHCKRTTKVKMSKIKPPKGYGKKPRRVLPPLPYVGCTYCSRHLTIRDTLKNSRGGRY